MELSLEEEAKIAIFKQEVKQMSLPQVQQQLVMLYEQMLLTENKYKLLIKKQWGMQER